MKNEKAREPLASKILENTGNLSLRDLLELYINNPDDKQVRFLTPVFDFILSDGYDITGYALFEIPTDGVYCFLAKNGESFEGSYDGFDVYSHVDGEITAGYTAGGGEIYTENIEAAVRGYKSNL